MEENQVVNEEPKFKFPTEKIELPSKGLVYPLDNPLSSGVVEMKYMTAREEDILTNQNYITKGLVVDKLLQSLIVSKINYNDLVVGDKNALLMAARVLGYGSNYEFSYRGQEYEVDLATLENKEIDESKFSNKNEFEFVLPHSETPITFQLMTQGLENKIDRELKGLAKLKKEVSPEMTTRMKYLITSVDGNDDSKVVREFVDTYLLARDAKALRDHIVDFQPDVNFKYDIEKPNGEFEEIDIPITVNFFFPD
jgi:hypothetical protein